MPAGIGLVLLERAADRPKEDERMVTEQALSIIVIAVMLLAFYVLVVIGTSSGKGDDDQSLSPQQDRQD